MNVGSCFSGIGGLDYGLARAGLRHSFFCESDPWRRQVLAHHWPGVRVYEDVFQVAAGGGGRPEPGIMGGNGVGSDGGFSRTRTEDCDDRGDLLAGGFPCQDVSVAGQRRGLAGARSGLFYEFARIAESVRPRWVLVENVPGLLSSNGGRDFGAVVGTLADVGYGVAWRILDSRFFGVPQRRRRVFIVGALAESDPRAAAERAGEVLAVGSRCDRHPPTGTEARTEVAGTLGGGAGERGWAQDVERMTFLPTAYHFRTREDGGCFEEKEVNVSRASVGGSGGAKIALHTEAGVRRLTPTECERLQGLPDGWTDLGGTPDSRRYSGLGDAVTATVAEWIGRRLVVA